MKKIFFIMSIFLVGLSSLILLAKESEYKSPAIVTATSAPLTNPDLPDPADLIFFPDMCLGDESLLELDLDTLQQLKKEVLDRIKHLEAKLIEEKKALKAVQSEIDEMSKAKNPPLKPTPCQSDSKETK